MHQRAALLVCLMVMRKYKQWKRWSLVEHAIEPRRSHHDNRNASPMYVEYEAPSVLHVMYAYRLYVNP